MRNRFVIKCNHDYIVDFIRICHKIEFMEKKTLKESIAALEEKLFEAQQANDTKAVKTITLMLNRFKRDALKPSYTMDKK